MQLMPSPSNTPLRLAELLVYPLKSGAARHLPVAEVQLEGIVEDRRVAVIRPDGVALTAREHPRLLRVHARLNEQGLQLRADGARQLVIAWSELRPLVVQTAVSVWGQRVSGCVGHPEADAWMSCYLGAPVQLACMALDSRRDLAHRPGRYLTMADAAPLLLATRASLADLNNRLLRPVTMGRFRPNLVIAGGDAYDDDSWERIRIGDVEFAMEGGCDRCAVVTLDPTDPEGPRASEALAALSDYRRDDKGRVYFGQALTPLGAGFIGLGDEVEVLARRPGRVFAPARQRSADLLANRVLAPAVPPAAPTQSARRRLRCIGVADETHDVRTFRMVCEEGRLPTHLPGQFLMLHGLIEAEEWTRCYSVSSAPEDDHLAITVKRVPGGRVSNWLHDNLHPGSTLETSGVGGRFHFLARPAKKVLLLSGGSGVTPLMSMLRWIVRHALPVDLAFHHSARTPEDIIFAAELAALAKKHPGLRISFNVSRDGLGHPALPTPRLGDLDEAMLLSLCDDLPERTVFACGPDGWSRVVRQTLLGSVGLPIGHLLEEKFVAASASGQRSVRPYRVKFVRSGFEKSGDMESTLLEIARGAGVELKSGCEVGLCGDCRCRLVKGRWELAEWCADPDRNILGAAADDPTVVLACTTCPSGELELDL